MNSVKFIHQVEAYYGMMYRVDQVAEISRYLAAYDEEALSSLFRKLLMYFSGVFCFLPDIAIIEAIQNNFDIESHLKEKRIIKKVEKEDTLSTSAEDWIVPKGRLAKPYFDKIWNHFPKEARSARTCKWSNSDYDTDIQDHIL